jgi:hypothetical protein
VDLSLSYPQGLWRANAVAFKRIKGVVGTIKVSDAAGLHVSDQ